MPHVHLDSRKVRQLVILGGFVYVRFIFVLLVFDYDGGLLRLLRLGLFQWLLLHLLWRFLLVPLRIGHRHGRRSQEPLRKDELVQKADSLRKLKLPRHVVKLAVGSGFLFPQFAQGALELRGGLEVVIEQWVQGGEDFAEFAGATYLDKVERSHRHTFEAIFCERPDIDH